MGACRTAVNADLVQDNRTEQCEPSLTKQCDLRGAGGALNLEPDGYVGAVGVDSMGDKNLTEQCEISPAKTFGQRRGRGDTATTGKHNRRYKAYVKAVKKGELPPTQYKFVRYVFDGEKIGTETAQIWLEAMREDGVLREVVKRGKRAYELIT